MRVWHNRASGRDVKPASILWVTLGLTIFLGASALSVWIAYRTFSTTGAQAVSRMDNEERHALRRLSSIEHSMSAEQVYLVLGPPSEDFFLSAKWDGFGGSRLSQLRVYFADEHPHRIRWIKLGYFVYEELL
jgi:hypothetical protein